jgi:hypothetical protein
MRFMMIVRANKDSESGKMPSEELIAAMGKYNEELMKAGVLVDLSGLQPSSKGARNQGADRRLLDHQREIQGRCHRLGRARPRPVRRRPGRRN